MHTIDPVKIYNAFNDNSKASNLLGELSKSLTELFNFFEPAYFRGKFFILNELDDKFILPEEDSKLITFNKEQLLNQRKDFVIQIINNNFYLWEEFNSSDIEKKENSLIYFYKNKREYFIVNQQRFEITQQPFGSRFSNEFWELKKFLEQYTISKILHSSCPIFSKSWYDDFRIFFKGGGKDIPEKYMQESLKNFIDDIRIFKGEIGQYEANREHNLGTKRPVDLLIKWEKSNRIALIEIKWLGKSKNNDNNITSTYTNIRATEGYKQLKDYYELAKRDYPNKIIKCYLVVIDGRRWQTNIDTEIISNKNGVYYADKELEIDNDKQYWQTFPSIEKPIRMFVEPICEI